MNIDKDVSKLLLMFHTVLTQKKIEYLGNFSIVKSVTQAKLSCVTDFNSNLFCVITVLPINCNLLTSLTFIENFNTVKLQFKLKKTLLEPTYIGKYFNALLPSLVLLLIQHLLLFQDYML